MERAEYFRKYFQSYKDFTNSDDIDPLINLSVPHLKKFAIVLQTPEGRKLFKEGTDTTDDEIINSFEQRLVELIEEIQAADEDTDTSISDENGDENIINNGNDNPVMPTAVLANVERNNIVADNIADNQVEVENENVVLIDSDGDDSVNDNEEEEESANPKSVASTIVITDDDDNKTIELSDSGDEHDVTVIAVNTVTDVVEEEEPSTVVATDDVVENASSTNNIDIPLSPQHEREKSVSSIEAPMEEENELQNAEGPSRIISSSSSQIEYEEEQDEEAEEAEEQGDETVEKRKRIISPSESEEEHQQQIRKKNKRTFESPSNSENNDDDDDYEAPTRKRRRSTRHFSSKGERMNSRNKKMPIKKKKKSSPKLQNAEQQPCSSKSFVNFAKKEEKDKKLRRPNFPSTKGMPRELARLLSSNGAQEAQKNKILPCNNNPKICYKDPVLIKSSSSSSRSSENDDEEEEEEDVGSNEPKISMPYKEMQPLKNFRFGDFDLAGERRLYIKEGEKECRKFLYDDEIVMSKMKIYYCHQCRKHKKETHAVLSKISTDGRVDPNHHKNCALEKWNFS